MNDTWAKTVLTTINKQGLSSTNHAYFNMINDGTGHFDNIVSDCLIHKKFFIASLFVRVESNGRWILADSQRRMIGEMVPLPLKKKFVLK